MSFDYNDYYSEFDEGDTDEFKPSEEILAKLLEIVERLRGNKEGIRLRELLRTTGIDCYATLVKYQRYAQSFSMSWDEDDVLNDRVRFW